MPSGSRQQSTRELMVCFQIGSRRTLYKILRFAGGRNSGEYIGLNACLAT
jgi:hypothetical protein